MISSEKSNKVPKIVIIPKIDQQPTERKLTQSYLSKNETSWNQRGGAAEDVLEKFGDSEQQMKNFVPIDKGHFIAQNMVKTYSKKFKSRIIFL